LFTRTDGETSMLASLFARRQPRRAAGLRPRLEVLEGRAVPAKVTATTWTVTNNLDSGAGSLRAEIAAANPGDTIAFAPGLDGQTIRLTSGELTVTRSLSIQGPGAGLLAISGGDAWRVFEVSGTITAGPNVLLSGLTITAGNGRGGPVDSDGGGGVLNRNGSTLTISGCTLSNNHDDTAGGAVSNYFATLKVINSTLSGNAVTEANGLGEGGAVSSVGGGSVSLTGCALSDNHADYGGAVYDANTTMTVGGCALSGNWASGGLGGAIYDGGTTTTLKNGRTTTTLTVSDSTFSGNYVLNYYGVPTYSFPIDGPWTNGGGNTFE
jgi:hypothetical protein